MPSLKVGSSVHNKDNAYSIDIIDSQRVKGWMKGKVRLEVNPRSNNDASPMSYKCMLRLAWMFMDRMLAPINVHT